jgi:hypothetical protein
MRACPVHSEALEQSRLAPIYHRRPLASSLPLAAVLQPEQMARVLAALALRPFMRLGITNLSEVMVAPPVATK